MENWVKLSSQLINSSVWKYPAEWRIVWITMLTLKDEEGFVRGTAAWLAEVARVSEKECELALKALAAPDPKSRWPENEGRRIEAIPGGWMILNHHLYRTEADMQRDKWREAKKRQRQKEQFEHYKPVNPGTKAEQVAIERGQA